MFVTEDPYGTNTTSLYVYFTTDDAVAVSYTVHADGYTDFTRDAYQESQYSKTHEFQLLGLIPGEKNTVAITLTDADGKSRTHTIEHRGASLLGNEEVQLEQTVAADSVEDLGDGLYAILGNDSDEQDFMFYYDTNGVLRGEIPVLYYRSHRLLFDDDGLILYNRKFKLLSSCSEYDTAPPAIHVPFGMNTASCTSRSMRLMARLPRCAFTVPVTIANNSNKVNSFLLIQIIRSIVIAIF